MSIALEKIAEIKRLRKQGLGYDHIAYRLKVSERTVYNYGKVVHPKRHVREICKAWFKQKELKCMRSIGHNGVHLSDETGKLIYWE